jgi:biotin carboxyl carrier protein
MRSYQVSIGEREYQVRIHQGKLTVDGEPLDVSLTTLNGSGMHLLRRNRQALELYFSHQDMKTYQVLVEGHLVQALVRLAGRGAYPQRKTCQEGHLLAPMPGLVVDVHVTEGEVVEKGQLMAVVESMKMQMQLRAAMEGRVRRVAVRAGEQVEKGQLLIQLETK